MSFAGNKLKLVYANRTPADAKTIHVLSSGFKALLTWHMMRTAQVLTEISKLLTPVRQILKLMA